MGSNDITIYLCHECQAKRGSIEKASCNVVDVFSVLKPGQERKLIV
jgi:hypothetical protein